MSNQWFIGKFKDKETEKAFRRIYDSETRVFIRTGLILASFIWISGLIVFYNLYNDRFIELALPILLFILPFKVVVIIITYSDKYLKHLQWMTAVTNSSAGLFTLYFTHQIVADHTLALALVMVLVFFCFLIFRIRIKAGIITTFSYIIPFQLILIFSGSYSQDDALLHSAIIWLTEAAVIVGAYVVEYSMRTIFEKNLIIEESKQNLILEKEKSENLLLNILPGSIAKRLRNNEKNIADNFEYVTVLFADIVGFTDLSNNTTPQQLVKMLNEVFSQFDDLAEKHRLEKIKTIGDAYMVAAGIPEHREDHAIAITEFALDMVSVLSTFPKQNGKPLQLRIGINSGPVIAGVIGKKKFIYDLWGDSVNSAARMESQGIAGEIQVTRSTFELTKGKYHFEERGKIEIKGKGKMETFLLKGRK